jgi:hypothetical protein
MPSGFKLRSLESLLLLAVALGLSPVRAKAQDKHHKGGAHAKAAHAKAAPPPKRHEHVEGEVKSAPKAAAPAEPAPEESMTTRGPARLDFDDRLVQGQSNKAGAIFLYDRKSLPLRSMVHTRTNFRDQIEDELPLEGER